jgi:hypothetical protein
MRKVNVSVLCLSALLVFAACGKKNKSGGGGTPNVIGQNYVVPGGNGTINYVSILQMIPCLNGQQRTAIQQVSNTGSVAVSAMYVGVTLEGDVAFMTSNGGQPVFTAYVCLRPNMSTTLRGSVMGVVPNRTLYGCPFDELVATVDTTGYRLAFFPLHLSPYGRTLGCKY